MSVDSADIQVMEVGDSTNIAGAQEAAKHNAQAVSAVKQDGGNLAAEVQHAHGAEVQAKQQGASKLTDTSTHNSCSVAGGNTEAGVYADVMTSALTGGSASVEAASMLIKAATDTDPAAGYGYTFADGFKDMLKKGPGVHKSDAADAGGEKCIKTKHSFDIASKGTLAGKALTGDTGNTGTWGGLENNSAALSQKLTLTKAKSHKLEQGAGNAIRKQAELGGQAFQAQQKFGMGSSAVAKLNKEMHFKPSDSLGDDIVASDDTSSSSWA